MSSTYRYSPLDENAQQIRLLTLLPEALSPRNGSRIKIRLDTAQLNKDNDPEFEALSYTWGSTDNSLDIWIETDLGPQALKVTRNLFDGLMHLRYESQPRILWIDAICIDQQNIPERSSQVRRMADIFSWSKRVVVWLGKEADDSSVALDLMKDLGSKIEVDWAKVSAKAASTDASERHWADQKIPLPFNEQERTAIVRIFERPWFERLWIWQEIWLAGPGAIIVCGKKSLLWTAFRNAYFCFITKAATTTGSVHLSLDRSKLIYRLCRKDDRRSFSNLLRCTQGSKCTDPRDRIFSVQSLLFPWDPAAEIAPDYSKTVVEVYTEYFLTHAEKTKKLRLMTRCDLGRQVEGYPSWLPNWNTPQNTTVIFQAFASGNSAVALGHRKEQVLPVCGIILETIESVARHKTLFDSAGNCTVEDSGTALHEIARELRISEPKFEAFCHVLTAGLFDQYTYPRSENRSFHPNLAAALQYIADILKAPNFAANNYLPDGQLKFMRVVIDVISNRLLYRTANGTFGMAPNCAEPGDIVVALLGFATAMVLRPGQDNTYKVVGESYCYGYMTCEGFLGPLPSTHEFVWMNDKSQGGNHPGFVERGSGVPTVEDPRLGPLPSQWTFLDHDEKHLFHGFVNRETGEMTWFDPRLLSESLLARGVALQYFDLI